MFAQEHSLVAQKSPVVPAATLKFMSIVRRVPAKKKKNFIFDRKGKIPFLLGALFFLCDGRSNHLFWQGMSSASYCKFFLVLFPLQKEYQNMHICGRRVLILTSPINSNSCQPSIRTA